MIAEVILNSNAKQLNRVFDYEIPQDLASKVKIGSRVFVPFGNRKALDEGFVVNMKQSSSYEVKPIKEVDETEYIYADHIKLAKWMAKRYFCNISDCIKLMLPPGTTTKVIENRIKEKQVSFVSLRKTKEEINEEIENKKIKSEKQIKALKFLQEYKEALFSDLEMFAQVSRSIIHTLEKKGYVEIKEKQIERNPFLQKKVQASNKLVLTKEQEEAFKTVADAIDDHFYSEFLLFGVTGSRKNRSVYATN
ncbi:MAG: hypothetical protein HFJ28_00570 [Clostridia bacterium]|nr:hypothetical protein [Clostridia bacterium]